MKKILHIPNYFPPHIGGIEQTASDIVKAFNGKYEQAVICFNSSNETVEETINGIKIVRVGYFAKIASQAISTEYKKALKKLIKEFKPDYIHFHFPNPFVSGILLRILKNNESKIIVHWHTDILKQKIIRGFFVNQTYKLLNIASKIIATSDNYVQGSTYLKLYEDKVTVIPSCINEERMIMTDSVNEASLEIRRKYEGKLICFYLGRITKHKGIFKLIEAAEKLDDRYKILIGGTGADFEKANRLASNNTNIEFLGKLNDEEYKAYLMACDIFCFPSISKAEAFGLALAEAMYYAKPTVTFTIPGSGVNFVALNDVTALEVKSYDSALYANAIEKLADKSLREKLGNAGRERVLANFTFETFKANIAKLYDELERD